MTDKIKDYFLSIIIIGVIVLYFAYDDFNSWVNETTITILSSLGITSSIDSGRDKYGLLASDYDKNGWAQNSQGKWIHRLDGGKVVYRGSTSNYTKEPMVEFDGNTQMREKLAETNKDDSWFDGTSKSIRRYMLDGHLKYVDRYDISLEDAYYIYYYDTGYTDLSTKYIKVEGLFKITQGDCDVFALQAAYYLEKYGFEYSYKENEGHAWLVVEGEIWDLNNEFLGYYGKARCKGGWTSKLKFH